MDDSPGIGTSFVSVIPRETLRRFPGNRHTNGSGQSQVGTGQEGEMYDRFRRSGWCTGETAWYIAGGGIVFLVDGCNGENRVHAESATQREAWWRAIEQTASVGMLADWPRLAGC